MYIFRNAAIFSYVFLIGYWLTPQILGSDTGGLQKATQTPADMRESSTG